MPSALFAVRFFIYIHENNGTGRFPHAVSESICIPGHFVELNLMTLAAGPILFCVRVDSFVSEACGVRDAPMLAM